MTHITTAFMQAGCAMRIPKTLSVRQFYVIFNLLRDIHEDHFSSPHAFQPDGTLTTTNAASDNDLDRLSSNYCGTAANRKDGTCHDSEGGRASYCSSCSDQHVELEEEDDECTICMDGRFEVVLHCSHSFCEQCFLFWQQKSDTCPICRQSVATSVQSGNIDKSYDELRCAAPSHKLRVFFHSVGKVDLLQPPLYLDDILGSSRSSSISNHRVPPWSCPYCTFNNNSGRRATCTVCGSHRHTTEPANTSVVPRNAMDMELQLAILLSME